MDWSNDIPPFDEAAAKACKARWDVVAKPLESLGRLEDSLIQIAGLTGDENCQISRRMLLILASDNGVVRQGVSQVGSEVTEALVRALDRGRITACTMAQTAGADVLGVDMGMLEDLGLENIRNCRIGPGTGDISMGPAMSKEQAIEAIEYGITLAGEMKQRGYQLLLTGEVGIGNTTTSSAMASVLLNRPVEEMTGRGAGLSSQGVLWKVEVIRRAIACNRPDPQDPLDVLSKLGGFDLAGLCGIYIGARRHRLPVLVDGLISSVAALIAQRLCPPTREAMIATHISAEPASAALLEALGLRPMLCAGMCLGEGTGAVAALPLLDMAYAVYTEGETFEGMEITTYHPQV